MESPRGTTRPDRKTVERNRRIQMKLLYSKLDSLIPASPSRERESVPLPNRLDEAVSYIKALQERMEKMKGRKRQLMGGKGMSSETAGGIRVSHIEAKNTGSGLRVVLVSTPDDRVVFYEVVRVLEEEGAEVVNAGFSAVGGKALHTIHSVAKDRSSGLEAGKVLESLKTAIHAVC